MLGRKDYTKAELASAKSALEQQLAADRTSNPVDPGFASLRGDSDQVMAGLLLCGSGGETRDVAAGTNSK